MKPQATVENGPMPSATAITESLAVWGGSTYPVGHHGQSAPWVRSAAAPSCAALADCQGPAADVVLDALGVAARSLLPLPDCPPVGHARRLPPPRAPARRQTR